MRSATSSTNSSGLVWLKDADIRAGLLCTSIDAEALAKPSHAAFERWSWIARFQGGVPLLYKLVDTIPTDLHDADRQEVHDRQVATMCRCVELEHHLVEVSEVLRKSGVRSVVLKGLATAHLDYASPSQREYGDIDLLVEPRDRPVASKAILDAGWKQAYSLPVGHDRFYHAITFERDGVELDLHQHVSHRALGRLIDTTDLIERSVPIEIAGENLFALRAVDRFIHAAVHAATNRNVQHRKLSGAADVLLLSQRLAERADEVVDQADYWRVRSIVELGVLACHQDARLDPPTEWTNAMNRPNRCRDRLVDLAYLGTRRRPVTEEAAYLRLLPTWTDRWRYVSGYLRIDEEYREQRGRSGRLAQVKYLSSKLRPR